MSLFTGDLYYESYAAYLPPLLWTWVKSCFSFLSFYGRGDTKLGVLCCFLSIEHHQSSPFPPRGLGTFTCALDGFVSLCCQWPSLTPGAEGRHCVLCEALVVLWFLKCTTDDVNWVEGGGHISVRSPNIQQERYRCIYNLFGIQLWKVAKQSLQCCLFSNSLGRQSKWGVREGWLQSHKQELGPKTGPKSWSVFVPPGLHDKDILQKPSPNKYAPGAGSGKLQAGPSPQPSMFTCLQKGCHLQPTWKPRSVTG